MKQPLTLLATALLGVPALAQSPITLTQSTFPASATSVERYQPTISTGVSTPSTGANQSWDYRGLTPSGAPYSDQNQPVPAGGISGAQWTLPRTVVFSTIGYNYTGYYALASTGRMALGRTVPRQATSLTARTGGLNDSLVISRQTVRYGSGSSGVVDFPLPLTASGRSQSFFRFGVTGTLTAAGLTQAPFRIVQRYTFVDSVAGWGSLRIPVAGRSTGSDPLPVLLVRSRTIRQDSIYLNGQPAPVLLLAAFGLTQGSVTTTYYDHFWRTGSAQPLLALYYPSRQYTAPFYVEYSTESNVLAVKASSAVAAQWQAWPNPLATGQPLQLALPGAQAGQPVRLTVTDALGRPVLTQQLPLLSGGTTLPATATDKLRAGLYTLTVQQGPHQASTKLLRQ